MKTSARNHFTGRIVRLDSAPVGDNVTLRTADGMDVHALLTSGTAVSLGLSLNSEAFALVRATSVILLVGFDNSKVSARNCFKGRIGFIEKGLVNAEVAVAAHGGTVVAFVTNDSVGRLGLTVGRMATAIFKATSVIIGVD